MTYGEIKREIPSMTIEALDDLRLSCVDALEHGVKSQAEQELHDLVVAEMKEREANA